VCSVWMCCTLRRDMVCVAYGHTTTQSHVVTLLGFLTETNAFFKTTPRCLPEHPDTGDPPGAG
jgi:hypothetical protein